MLEAIELSWVKLMRIARLWVLFSKIEEYGLTEFFAGEDKVEHLKGAEFHIVYNSMELVISWDELSNIRRFLIESASDASDSNAASKLIRDLTQTPGTERDGAVMAMAFHLMSVIVP